MLSSASTPLLRRRSILATNLILLLLVGWGFAGEFLRNRAAQEEISLLEARAAELERHNFEAAKISRTLGISETVEREARIRLGLRKPGEQVVIIKDAPRFETVGSSAIESSVAVEKPNPIKWWNFIFGSAESG